MHLLDKQNNVRPKIASEAVSQPNFDQLKRNLVHFINTMIRGSMPKVGTAPPIRIEIQKKCTYLLITFEQLSPIRTVIVSQGDVSDFHHIQGVVGDLIAVRIQDVGVFLSPSP